PGTNQIRVFPKIKAVGVLIAQPISAVLVTRFRIKERLFAARIYLIEKVLPPFLAKALRSLKRKLNGT
ncbi:hypothetical protein, partial [Microvirga roseola]|uniref:hypothetical protein n=1 Tax=Microvirga roseola TaxID=2883126 RepID=UPI001E30EAF6